MKLEELKADNRRSYDAALCTAIDSARADSARAKESRLTRGNWDTSPAACKSYRDACEASDVAGDEAAAAWEYAREAAYNAAWEYADNED